MNSNPLPHTDVADSLSAGRPEAAAVSLPDGSAFMNFGARPSASQPAAHAGAARSRVTRCDDPEIQQLLEERDALQAKLDRLADVIGCKNPAKIEHDLRNVMNELVLLRKLAEDDD